LVNFIIGLCNGGINDIAIAATWLLSFLPDSPFSYISNSPIGQYLPALNWIIPVQMMVDSMSVWLTAIGFYYLLAIIMRWIKVIGD
jgi:uncharacterized membrane protein